MPTYDMTTSPPGKIKTGDILNYPYTGAAVETNLPAGRYKLEVWGAQGGYRSSASYGGKGGYAVGTLALAQPTKIHTRVGGSGNTGKTAGGFNGGGKRGTYNGGGGATDIRIGTDGLLARVIVGPGGGSDGASNKQGMYGGGENGGSSTQSYGTGGYGGTQTGVSGAWQTTAQSDSTTTQAGAYAGFGFGGNGITRSSGYGGAGGAGWYGGSGSYPDSSGDDDRGGGGGSAYVYTAATAANYPAGCLLDASYYLTDTQLIAGNAAMTSPDGASETGHTGDGYARITAIEVYPTTPDAPTGFVQTGKDYFEISLAWSASELATGYRLWRDGELIADLTGLTYTDTGVSPNGTYTYTLRGYNAEGLGDPATLTAKTTQGYAIIRPEITAASFDVNPADINTETVLTVAVEDKILILHPEVWYAGEIYAGEIHGD